MNSPRGLLLCRTADAGMIQSLFPDRHAWLLPVAGKPIIEYQLETLSRLGVQEVRILCDKGTGELEARYGSGEQLGLKLSYGALPSQDNLSLVLNRNKAFCDRQALVVIQGLAVMAPIHAPHCLSITQATDLSANNSDALILGLPPHPEGQTHCLSDRKASELTKLPWVESRSIRSLNAYYQENISLMLRWRERISWPAYGSQNGFQIAERVSLGAELNLKGHGLIGGLSVLAEDILLEDSILGREVMIGAGCQIRQSIILDGSWVGPGLQIENKIVDGRVIIDPDTGTRLELSEPGWFDTLEHSSLANISERLLAGVLWILLLPLYLLWGGEKMLSYRVKHGELHLPLAGSNLAGRLQLHRVPRWRAVMCGDLALVGQEPVLSTQADPASLYPKYRPAAIAFSETQGSTGEQARLDDASYPLFTAPRKNICICLSFLKNCLFRPVPGPSGITRVAHER